MTKSSVILSVENKSYYIPPYFLFGIYTPGGRQGPSLMTSSISGREQKHSHLSNPKVNFNFNEDNHSLTTQFVLTFELFF